MAQYTLAVGTNDPHLFAADSEADALRGAIAIVRDCYGDDLRRHPEEVATLLGPSGLLTRPSERIDEFVARSRANDPSEGTASLRPGDTNAPDCNGD